jgi:hypothetical protein
MSGKMSEKKDRRTPRGVIVIATLLIVVVFFSAGVGTLVRGEALAEAGLTRPLLLSFALVTSVLAYGLLRLRRWAWGATLSFVIVQACFLLLQSLVAGGNLVFAFLPLLFVFAYLMLPSVRAVFLVRR